jgi:hypothetical protein
VDTTGLSEAGAQATAWASQYRHGWVGLCFLLMVIDVAYLGVRTLLGRTHEPPFGDYFIQHVSIALLLVVIGLVDYLLPTVPLLYGASLFYSGVFILSIVQQVRAEGVTDLPPGLKERAEDMQRATKQP